MWLRRGICRTTMCLTLILSWSTLIWSFEIVPTSLVTRGDPPRQKMILKLHNTTGQPARWSVRVMREGQRIGTWELGVVHDGFQVRELLLPEPDRACRTTWIIETPTGKQVSRKNFRWQPPRHWTLYLLKSSHLDIGLHQPQYAQRDTSVRLLQHAVQLAEQTSQWPEASRFRYVVEGQWWWRNFVAESRPELVETTVRKLVKTGIIGIGAGHSGNHTQAFGNEQLIRSSYYVREARKRWGLAADTMIMADNNGLSWPLVTAYAEAGIKNVVFLPNNALKAGTNVGWDAPVPHLFYWQGPGEENQLLVWSGPHYTHTGRAFGIRTCANLSDELSSVESVEPRMVKQLAHLEDRYPYNVWLVANYADNEEPTLHMAKLARAWNARWRWPELRTTGDLSEPFDRIRERFHERIPVLRGDITGGWAHHPLATPTYLSRKREADRLLATAEKIATVAQWLDPKYCAPVGAFRAAWDALICSDEHGYGVSAYEGKDVYCTWMQKRAWIDRGLATAGRESGRALETLATHIPTQGRAIVVFNPLLHVRSDLVEAALPGHDPRQWSVICPESGEPLSVTVRQARLKFLAENVPPMGYRTYELRSHGKCDTNDGDRRVLRAAERTPPVIENRYYRVTMARDGSIQSIFDKQLDRDLLDQHARYRGNQFVYTRDDHQTFSTPAPASFVIEQTALATRVISRSREPHSGAEIEQRISLPHARRRIDIDNRLYHVTDLFNQQRTARLRYGYYAFPWKVPDATFHVQLNGCTARPHADQVGIGTEDWMAAQDYVVLDNGHFHVTWAQRDSHVVECGRIRTRQLSRDDPPEHSHLFSYLFNDWYQRNWTGPRDISLRYRYSLTSGPTSEESMDAGHWFARRFSHPLLATVVPAAQTGTLPRDGQSFLCCSADNLELLTLKPSEAPGRGIVARLHETSGREIDRTTVAFTLATDARRRRCNVLECDRRTLSGDAVSVSPFGYATLRFEDGERPDSEPIVSIEAADDRSITLSWERVAGAGRYHVFRAARDDFRPHPSNHIATTTEPGYRDIWLCSDRLYVYRVLAVGPGNSPATGSVPVGARTSPPSGSPPAPIGYHNSGLITAPTAWRGDESDQLYLLWGQNRETDLDHYELYRGESSSVAVGEETFLANVPPGPYVVVSYDDTGLRPGTTYFYRVRAVDHLGNHGVGSAVFSGTTRGTD